MNIKTISVLISCLFVSTQLFANMVLTSSAFHNGALLPDKYIYCKANGSGGIAKSLGMSPALSWQAAPPGTKSFALLVSDPDVAPSKDYNLAGTTIPLTAKRQTMYHWVVVNIPVTQYSFPEGAGAKQFVMGGIKPGLTSYGLMGLNLYNLSMNADSPIPKRISFGYSGAVKGLYGQYGGMCAPFNDEAIHNYIFTLYALDVASLDLPSNGIFTGEEALEKIQGHVIETAILTAKSITNPKYL